MSEQGSSNKPRRRPSWIASQRAIPRLLARPLREFLRTEIAGGVVLLIGTVVALVWANSPYSDSYKTFWETKLSFSVGGFEISEDLKHWVNDGLMTLFFFVVGLEIKRELVRGELREGKRAALPVAAAVGGMVVPALIYIAFNAGAEGASRGWGIPMATDIAFALGVLALVAPRVPSGLKVFLLSLAIVDDIGAIVVIAIFYSEGVGFGWLTLAFAIVGLIVVLQRLKVWWIPVYSVVGVALWLAVFESGVHATLAGVALGLLTPVFPLDPSLRRRIPIFEVDDEEERGELSPRKAQQASKQMHIASSVAERIGYILHPWTSYVIVPIFALANAGVKIDGDALSGSFTSSVTLGVLFGLVIGKLVGVTGAAWLAERYGLGQMPEGVNLRDLMGTAALAGIGFTVSLFITELALTGDQSDEAKIGVLVASLVASVVGAILLRRPRTEQEMDPEVAGSG